MSFILTERFTERIESAWRLYLSRSWALVAVWSAAGAWEGFTTVLWLTEQPEARSQGVAARARKPARRRIARCLCAARIGRSSNRDLPSVHSKCSRVPAVRKRVNERA